MFKMDTRLVTRGKVEQLDQRKQVRRVMASRRRGVAAVLGLFLVLSLVVLMGVTLDFGNIRVAQNELQRAADAAAMAACWEVYEVQSQSPGSSQWSMRMGALQGANAISAHNVVGEGAPQLDFSDVEVGAYDAITGQFNSSSSTPNAVQLILRRQSSSNGELPLFFGGLTGRDTQSLQTTATAAMFSQIIGFNEPHSGDSIGILPIALDEPSWQDAVNGISDDDYAFSNGSVDDGSDGVSEANLYPKGTGAPGNRGTLDIGGADNSTDDLTRQILHGISRQDLIELGKPLVFDDNGELELNGDTGISAGIKDELASLIGKTRIIPIFTKVQGNGNNAVYTIVRFEGVRILDVKLTGPKNKKRVMIQPAKVIARGTIIDYSGTTYSSHLVTPVMLVE